MEITGNTTINKLILLFVFDKMEIPLTENTVIEMCSSRNTWITYMECTEALGQLIEAGFNLILFVVLLNCAKKLKRPAFVLPLYMILYGIARFVLEFYRGDAERGIALLSTSQWISIVCVMLAIIFLTHAFNKKEDK